MKNILFLAIGVFFIAGCSFGTKNLELKPHAKLSTLSVSVNTSNSFPSYPWEAWFVFSEKYIQLFRHLPNMMSEDVRITVEAIPQNEIANDYLLYKNKNGQMEERYKNFKMSDWEKKNNAERGVRYVKNYIDFIGEMKCGTRVESSSIALGVGVKSYQTNCNYFDNQNGAKNIHFYYHYISSFNGTKFQDSTSTIASGEDLERLFKQDMKEIFDSLVIHDMDREKMSKDGLLHDRKYDIDGEFK